MKSPSIRKWRRKSRPSTTPCSSCGSNSAVTQTRRPAQCSSSGDGQCSHSAALNALPGPGVHSAVQSLAAVCETHGLGREVQVLADVAQSPLTTRSLGRFCSAFDSSSTILSSSPTRVSVKTRPAVPRGFTTTNSSAPARAR